MKRNQAETNQADIEDIMSASDEGAARLTAEELMWVRLAIKKQAQTLLFRQAIIEKTLSALIWSAIVGIGFVLLEAASAYLVAHGWRK